MVARSVEEVSRRQIHIVRKFAELCVFIPDTIPEDTVRSTCERIRKELHTERIEYQKVGFFWTFTLGIRPEAIPTVRIILQEI
ncbi:hypothetical protein A2450_02965 [candidate division WWE3 bacterium RIFOXYC2_FULL_40_11]|nr:MAG: hypothetical protein A2450_02965 [candidate division WWE3 bacterium RIFOXYC2_FULL_40_11]OGC70895.1 MAG: hypothetical protein A2602_03700 [candidate division WWE3 bacterium RIFOXYD1_FULL_40_11]